MKRFWLALLLIGCGESAALVTTQGPIVDSPDAAIEDPEPVPTPVDKHDSGTSDARTDVYVPPSPAPVPPTPPPPPPDQDAATDAGDAGSCVDYVRPPATPGWVVWSHYPTFSQPFYCPDSVQGNSCRYALLAHATTTASGPVVYPYPAGSCHITVPSQCLPCTNGLTAW